MKSTASEPGLSYPNTPALVPFPRCRMVLTSVLRTFACVSSYFRSFSLNSSCTLSFRFLKVPVITGPRNLFCACHICIQDRDFNIFETDTILIIGQPREKWTCFFLGKALTNILYVMILKNGASSRDCLDF